MTIQIEVADTMSVALPKAKTTVEVAVAKLPPQSLAHIFNYGLRQILNDAMAPAKTDAEAIAGAQKRLDNLIAGTLRAAPTRTGDPVMRRAKELAANAVEANPKFIAWAAEKKVKKADKVYRAMVESQVAKALAKPDNAYIAQAKVDVEAAKALDAIEIEL